MGKMTDAAIAIIVIIIGLWIFTRLGLTLPAIESMFHKFFFPSPGSVGNNTTAGLIMFGMAASNSRIRQKFKNRFVEIKRRILARNLKREENEAKAREHYDR
jgi:hypothetical protein